MRGDNLTPPPKAIVWDLKKDECPREGGRRIAEDTPNGKFVASILKTISKQTVEKKQGKEVNYVLRSNGPLR